MTQQTRTSEEVRNQVREGYANIARSGGAAAGRSNCGSGGCCGGVDAEALATHIGYDLEEIQKLPDAANMGLSCGNPTALAALSPGEVVVDLGSGGGFDCFLAGPRVGATGRVIGIDMTPEMLELARRNVPVYTERSGLANVEFRLGEIEHLPVADASVDVVLSNCVINLTADKAPVWKEIARVLKPGGRVSISDIALLRELPEDVAAEVQTWVGCVAGAIRIEDTRGLLEEAGFTDIELTPKDNYVRSLEAAEDPLYVAIAELLGKGEMPHDYVTSLDISARRR